MTPFDDPLLIAASEALARRDRGFTAAELQEYHEWIEADPRHAAIVGHLERVWKRLDQLRVHPGRAWFRLIGALDRDRVGPPRQGGLFRTYRRAGRVGVHDRGRTGRTGLQGYGSRWPRHRRGRPGSR